VKLKTLARSVVAMRSVLNNSLKRSRPSAPAAPKKRRNAEGYKFLEVCELGFSVVLESADACPLVDKE
jgi:hypothetical protein